MWQHFMIIESRYKDMHYATRSCHILKRGDSALGGRIS